MDFLKNNFLIQIIFLDKIQMHFYIKLENFFQIINKNQILNPIIKLVF